MQSGRAQFGTGEEGRRMQMQAMQITALGAPMELRRVARPEPGPGEVLLRVRACGVNFADTLMARGRYQERPALPFTPGMEVCGIVEDGGATDIDPGTRVAAFCGMGGFAEYLAVPAERCVAVPERMTDADAAGFLIAYGTSHVALAHRAALRPGETLLVLGATGGVGLTAVELGKLLGARVIAVASGPAKLDAARHAGADHAIDSGADVRAEVKALGGADVVIDPVGGPLFEAALRSCRPGARLLPLGFASGDVPQIPANILLVKNLTVIGLYWGGYAAQHPEVVADSFATLFAWAAQGLVRPHVSRVMPLAEAEAALDLLRRREATGKVVIEVTRV
jgi:NADPH2:quinone reductase